MPEDPFLLCPWPVIVGFCAWQGGLPSQSGPSGPFVVHVSQHCPHCNYKLTGNQIPAAGGSFSCPSCHRGVRPRSDQTLAESDPISRSDECGKCGTSGVTLAQYSVVPVIGLNGDSLDLDKGRVFHAVSNWLCGKCVWKHFTTRKLQSLGKIVLSVTVVAAAFVGSLMAKEALPKESSLSLILTIIGLAAVFPGTMIVWGKCKSYAEALGEGKITAGEMLCWTLHRKHFGEPVKPLTTAKYKAFQHALPDRQ